MAARELGPLGEWDTSVKAALQLIREDERGLLAEALKELGCSVHDLGHGHAVTDFHLIVADAQRLRSDCLQARQPQSGPAVLLLADPGELGSLRSFIRNAKADFLLRPYSRDELTARLLVVVRRHSPENEAQGLFLQQIIEHIPDMIFVKEAETLRFVRFNAAGEKLLGIPREEMIGKRDHDFFPQDEADFFNQKDREVLASGIPKDIPEETIQTRHGERTLRTKKVPVLDEQGKPRYLLGISEDITERKEAEERQRAMAARLQSAQEHERLRISRELHDELGQLLTALQIDLAWIERRLPPEEELLLGKVAAMEALVDTTLGTVRKISTRLRPQILDDLGLTAGIDWLAQQICSRSQVEYQLSSHLDEQRLQQDSTIALFRICQEALSNVARHADAHRAWIRLFQSEDRVVLEVEDDGCGIGPSQGHHPAGDGMGPSSLGLVGIQERAHNLGGEVEIGSPGPRGTVVRVSLPLPATL